MIIFLDKKEVEFYRVDNALHHGIFFLVLLQRYLDNGQIFKFKKDAILWTSVLVI